MFYQKITRGTTCQLAGKDMVDQWKNYRNALLSEDLAKLFYNDFLEYTGLADPLINTPQELIVSLQD